MSFSPRLKSRASTRACRSFSPDRAFLSCDRATPDVINQCSVGHVDAKPCSTSIHLTSKQNFCFHLSSSLTRSHPNILTSQSSPKPLFTPITIPLACINLITAMASASFALALFPILVNLAFGSPISSEFSLRSFGKAKLTRAATADDSGACWHAAVEYANCVNTEFQSYYLCRQVYTLVSTSSSEILLQCSYSTGFATMGQGLSVPWPACRKHLT